MTYRNKNVYRGMLIAGVALLPCVAGAQVLPGGDSQASQRIDGYYDQRRLQPVPGALSDPLQEVAPANDGKEGTEGNARLYLAAVRFTASELLPAEALAAVGARFEGREVSLAELDQLVTEVNGLYEARGITTAKAMLREQSIEDGQVEVTLLEGRLGALQVTGEGRVSESFVRRRVRQQEGQVVRSDQLRDDLVYLNRTSDVQVQALLRPGQQAGQTDIVLMTKAPAAGNWGVFVDNAGVETTGRERYGVQGQLWGLAGVNDLLSGSVAYSRGGLEGRISYSGLVNTRNGRLGATVSRSQINIIDGAYRDLDITGESTNYGLEYVQPWIAGQRWLLSTLASASRSSSISEIAGVQVSETDSTILTLGVSAGYRNDGRDWSFYQGVSRVTADETLATGRTFTVANGNTAWTQRLGGSGLLYRAQLGWQFTSGDFLPPGNLFQVGGIGSVRGYVRGALSGVRGYFGSVELHRPYLQGHDVYLFVDHGQVRGDFPVSESISSVGVGLNGQFARRYSYSLDLGHPLDDVLKDQDTVRVDFRLGARW